MEQERKRFYTRCKTIGGVRYTAQFNGLGAALAAVDECTLDAGGAIGLQKLTAYILEKVIVEPGGLCADDFEDMDSLSAVVQFGREVMQGRFRAGGEPDPAAADGGDPMGRVAAGGERI